MDYRSVVALALFKKTVFDTLFIKMQLKAIWFYSFSSAFNLF